MDNEVLVGGSLFLSFVYVCVSFLNLIHGMDSKKYRVINLVLLILAVSMITMILVLAPNGQIAEILPDAKWGIVVLFFYNLLAILFSNNEHKWRFQIISGIIAGVVFSLMSMV